jgi:chromosome segregation ATPase
LQLSYKALSVLAQTVADEVRTLAKRTQDQTSQIHDIISKLQQDTLDTKLSMEQSRNEMDLSVQEATVVEGALERITEVISTINKMSAEISTLATDQSHVTKKVASQVEEIAVISETTLDGAEQTESSANELLLVVHNLKNELGQMQKARQRGFYLSSRRYFSSSASLVSNASSFWRVRSNTLLCTSNSSRLTKSSLFN